MARSTRSRSRRSKARRNHTRRVQRGGQNQNLPSGWSKGGPDEEGDYWYISPEGVPQWPRPESTPTISRADQYRLNMKKKREENEQKRIAEEQATYAAQNAALEATYAKQNAALKAIYAEQNSKLNAAQKAAKNATLAAKKNYKNSRNQTEQNAASEAYRRDLEQKYKHDALEAQLSPAQRNAWNKANPSAAANMSRSMSELVNRITSFESAYPEIAAIIAQDVQNNPPEVPKLMSKHMTPEEFGNALKYRRNI